MNLSELIRHHKGDRSYDELEKAAGGPKAITSQRLQQIAAGAPMASFPHPKGVRAIAKALGVKESVVVLAAAQSLGLDAELPALSEVLPAVASNLSDEEVAAVAHMIRAFKREDVMGNAEHPAPTTTRQDEPDDATVTALSDRRSTFNPSDDEERVANRTRKRDKHRSKRRGDDD